MVVLGGVAVSYERGTPVMQDSGAGLGRVGVRGHALGGLERRDGASTPNPKP